MSKDHVGPVENLFLAAVDKATGYLDEKNTHAGADGMGSWSYDWCRFRRDRHCWYPNELNQHASELAGYAVYVPFDRGICPRDKWDEQKKCPVVQPGPHSGDPGALIDATVPWEDGGQRNGVVIE